MKDYPKTKVMICQLAVGVFALLAGISTPSQEPKTAIHFASGMSSRDIPLDIDNNIIRLKVRINDSRPLMMIFDTGASVTFVHTRIAKELGLKFGDKLSGSATGGRIEGNLVGRAKLAVQGAEATEQLLFAQAFPTPPGFEFDGIIGYDFIKAFVVDIDYQKKMMSLYDPAAYKYSGPGHVVPLDLKGRRTPLVDAPFTFGKNLNLVARLELDTGADGAFLFNSPFVKKHYLLGDQKESNTNTGHGAGGDQQRATGTASKAALGKFSFSDVPVAFVLDEQKGEKADGVVGGEVLRRFRMIIDYSRSQMILEPNSDLRSAFDVDSDE